MNSSHRKSDAQDDLEGVSHVSMSMDYGFLGERESEEQVLVSRERRHKMTRAVLVPRKGTEFLWIAKRQRAGHWGAGEGNRTSSPRGKPDRPGETASGRKPVQWDHRTCVGTRGRSGQNTEGCAGASHWDQSSARRTDTMLTNSLRT